MGVGPVSKHARRRLLPQPIRSAGHLRANTAEGVPGVAESWDVEGEAALDAAVGKFVANLGKLNFELPDLAPKRPDMPVIDDEWAKLPKGGAAKLAIGALDQGEVDWNDPPAGEEEPDEEEEEKKNRVANRRESLLRRWTKLIK